jgi:ATP-dependent helicase/nuclease subunit A
MTSPVPPLKGTQADVRAEYFQHTAGLFVLDCKPGFGKSTTLNRIAAETLVRADAAGVRCPEQQLCVVSFAQEDAASIEPGIKEALDAFAADTDGEFPVEISRETADRLKRRVQISDRIGTIDSLLRGIFEDIAAELGFDGMPSVGDSSQLSLLQERCMAAVRDDPAYADALRRLDTMYPPEEGTGTEIETGNNTKTGTETGTETNGETETGTGAETGTETDNTVRNARLHSILEKARTKKRDRRLSIGEFEAELRAVVADVYPDGPPETLADLLEDVERFYDESVASDFADAQPAPQDGHQPTVVTEDRECYDEWQAAIDAFCTVLDAYEQAYDTACREQGVVSHADIAYWIAAYFDGSLADIPDAAENASEAYRTRVKRRYAAKFQSLIIDEAQDISIAQHDALSPFVSDDTRVLLAGDVDQCIYVWRNARPERFVTALEDGQYFQTEWAVHQAYSGSRTYRMRPDIAAAIDTIFGDVFTDPGRGGRVDALAADTTAGYPALEPTRTATPEPAIHIAGYTPTMASPGTEDWFNAEKTPLGNYLAGGLADGTFDIDTSDDETVTVLFSHRSNMDLLASQLTGQGLSVVNASVRLFDNQLIKLICRVVWWLVDPYDPARTEELVAAECLPLSDELTAVFEASQYHIDTVAQQVEAAPSAASELGVVAGLATLATRRGRHASDPGAIVVEEIIDRLDLRADPLGQVADPERRLAACDALVHSISAWEDSDHYTLAELAEILSGYVAEPKDGPMLPVPNTDKYDIVFRTIHNMKGDEDGVVCLADASGSVNYYGPHRDTFLALGDTLALAPPDTVSRTPLRNAEQNHVDAEYGPLRWASDYRTDGRIAGSPTLSSVSHRYCAEQWRLLYVALSRARDHLVLSLPFDHHEECVETSWVATLAEALSFDGRSSASSYEAPVAHTARDRPVTVQVNDVAFPDGTQRGAQQPTPRCGRHSATDNTGWTSRYVNGTSLYQLATEADDAKLSHIMGQRPETEYIGIESANVDLPDGVAPERLGSVTHEILTAAIARDLSTPTLTSFLEPLPSILDQSLSALPVHITPQARASIQRYLSDRICPQFAESDVWTQVRQSQTRYVEEPLDAVLRVDDVAIETQNRADLITVEEDDHWVVDEIKLAHTTVDPETKKQQRLQTAFYGWVLEQQLPPECTVTTRLTYLGRSVESVAVSAPIAPVSDWVATLGES